MICIQICQQYGYILLLICKIEFYKHREYILIYSIQTLRILCCCSGLLLYRMRYERVTHIPGTALSWGRHRDHAQDGLHVIVIYI